MTPIQIITLECSTITYRVMIENANRQYRIHMATKTTDYFSGFELVQNQFFPDAESALQFAVTQYIKNPIVNAQNEISDLLSSSQIISIAGLTQISGY
jgi:deoxyadenosine/deoxycytidine kinase